MILKLCTTHGVRHRLGTRCPQCPPKRGRDTAARRLQGEFRKAVVSAAGGMCQFHDANGVQCSSIEGLQAAHFSRYSSDGNFGVGTLLCKAHHHLVDHGE